MYLLKVDKYCNTDAVKEVHKHAANNGNKEIGLETRLIFGANSLDVRHGIGCCTHAKTTNTCCQDSCVIVLSQTSECNKIGKEGHESKLGS